MEKFRPVTKPDAAELELPPGFRFHPTDEELITHYLSPKVMDHKFSAVAIGEVDLNKVEPWELPWRGKMGEKEWYFFCLRDRKYPTGWRTNRASEAGYWKATGKDKEILRRKTLVGMKKTLVFYKGRAPKGEKTNWVMHEYRLEGNNSIHSSKPAKNEWVICRVFKKSSGGKKIHISGLVRKNKNTDDLEASNLPALMDFSSDDQCPKTTVEDSSHVTCLSNFLDDQEPLHHNLTFTDSATPSSSYFSQLPVKVSAQSLLFPSELIPCVDNLHRMDSNFLQEQSILRLLPDRNHGQEDAQNPKMELSWATNNLANLRPNGYDEYHDFPEVSTGPVDLDCLWSY